MTSQQRSIELKSKIEIEKMRKAGQLAAQTLQEVANHVQPGITTQELDKIASRFVKKNGGIPVFVGYRGYPATICASINEEVVHGIPSSRELKEGDIIGIDFATSVDGYVGDTAKTYPVGKISEDAQKLIDVTRKSLEIGIDMMKPGNRLGDLGSAIQKYVEGEGYGVVRDFVGHGIGRQMHEDPAVPNYGTPGTGIRLEEGLVLAIEPMVTMGDWQVKLLDDEWTVVTKDGKWAAHFEHTIAITDNGPEIMTLA